MVRLLLTALALLLQVEVEAPMPPQANGGARRLAA